MSFDWEGFFKKQIEKCRELETRAINAEDRAFWRQAAERWEEQFRQAQTQGHKRPRQYVHRRRLLSEDSAEF